MKTLYIFPGFKETIRSRPYKNIAAAARAKDYTVVEIRPAGNKDLKKFKLPRKLILIPNTAHELTSKYVVTLIEQL